MASSSMKPTADDLPLVEIVFSCAICQATVSDVYATTESNHGFHSGSGDEDGIVTKMWIAQCSHITCAKHLENGAAPFHPDGMEPQAPCPFCVQDKGDDTPKSLYPIRGLEDGQLDPTIPSTWLRCPAMKLDCSIPGMDALRFQYMALGHYARRTRKHWKDTLQKQTAMEAAYSKERRQRRQMQSELQELKKRVETLEECEAQLKKWEERKKSIYELCSTVGKLKKDNEDMRKQLVYLGYEVPEADYGLQPRQIDENAISCVSKQLQNQRLDTRDINVGHSAGELAMAHHEDVMLNRPGIPENETSSSARKRKRDEYPADPFHQDDSAANLPRRRSRDLMPPPLPKLKPSQKVVREPARIEARELLGRRPSSRQSVQVYQDNAWQPQQLQDVDRQFGFDQRRTHAHATPQHYAELPYRPSSVLTARRQLNSSHTGRDQPHAAPQSAYDARESFYPSHSFQQPGRDSMYVENEENRPPSREHHHSLLEQGRYQHSAYEQPNHRQQNGQSRLPPQSSSRSVLNSQPVAFNAQYERQTVRSPEKLVNAPSASVISPSFKRNAAAPEARIAQRSPSRGSYVRPRYAPLARDIPPAYGTSSGSTRGREIQTVSRSVNGDSRRPAGVQTQYQMPTERPDTYTQGRHASLIPQTPRNSQGLFQRPDRPPPSAMSYASQRSQANSFRSRVSLPLSNGPPMPLASSQDEALSRIAGVRGVSSQRGVPSYSRPGPAYDLSKNLFSAAGGRRSVRR